MEEIFTIKNVAVISVEKSLKLKLELFIDLQTENIIKNRLYN